MSDCIPRAPGEPALDPACATRSHACRDGLGTTGVSAAEGR
ncbi:hypothetical protein [Ralstonia pseudosolanacearum]|nr:hypothetical protein [Ralstonia pseudosolanacearum]